ncbi:MAG TPA: immunoglobulin-like domain-containing protein [Puia sp.]|nr:immunoglobulin-like domain-containing protein [Puia sp.]
MKNNRIHFFSIVLLLVVISSCKKDTIISNDKQVGTSKVTHFADLKLLGDPIMSIVKGAAFTDPGATASQSGAPLTVTVTGTVNTGAVGFYTVNYTATNSDGFPAAVSRLVAVLPSAEVAGVDLSGTYYYATAVATTSTITKLAPGVYATTNCWSNATTIACQFICADGTHIIMPSQATPYGTLSGTGTLSVAGALQYVVTIPEQGISGTPRNWHAQ